MVDTGWELIKLIKEVAEEWNGKGWKAIFKN